jgi:hypothetical protein
LHQGNLGENEGRGEGKPGNWGKKEPNGEREKREKKKDEGYERKRRG